MKNPYLYPVIAVVTGLACIALGFFTGTGIHYNSYYPILMTIGTILLIAGGSLILAARQGLDPKQLFDSLFGSAASSGTSAAGSSVSPALRAQLRKKVPEGYIEAKILGISRGLRLEGDREAYYVVCKYTEPVTGEELTYTSKPFNEYPGKELIGKKVKVYLRTLGDEDYRVDLNSVE